MKHILLALPVMLASAPLMAQTPTPAQRPAPAAITIAPASPAMMQQTGMFLKETARAAAQKAMNPAIRAFAMAEVAEQDSVSDAMAKAGHTASVEMTPMQTQMLQSLQAESGVAFDTMFLQSQMMGHAEALRGFMAMQQTSSTPADQVLAILGAGHVREHLAVLQNMMRPNP